MKTLDGLTYKTRTEADWSRLPVATCGCGQRFRKELRRQIACRDCQSTTETISRIFGETTMKTKTKTTKTTKAEARAAKDIASAAAYAAKHGLDKPATEAPGRKLSLRSTAVAARRANEAMGTSNLHAVVAQNDARVLAAMKSVGAKLGDALTPEQLKTITKAAKGSTLKLAGAVDGALHAEKPTKADKRAMAYGFKRSAAPAAEPVIDLRKQMLAEHKAKNGGSAAKPKAAKTTKTAKTAAPANADGKCAKCGRVNSHGGDCRVAAACAARRKSGAADDGR